MFSDWLSMLRRWWLWIVVFQLAILAFWLVSQGLTAESQVQRRAEKFRLAIADKNPEKARRMVSERYRDKWDMNPDELGLAVKDVTSQFLSLTVQWVDPVIVAADGKATITARAKVDGRPLTPVGNMMLNAANQLREPFVFRWEKEGWWPWTWRLVAIENVDYEFPSGYTPGMFSDNRPSLEEAMQRAAEQQ